MSEVYRLYAIESFDGMLPENPPFNIWLPYVQVNSERFFCRETNEVWHRFKDVCQLSEDDDYPEGDLIEDTEELPEGLVSWHGKNGIQPKSGDVFQVYDKNNNLLFEETIHGTVMLHGRTYAIAQKMAPLCWEAIGATKDQVNDVLGADFKRLPDPSSSLVSVSATEPVSTQSFKSLIRGIPFRIQVDEYVTTADCSIMNFKDNNFHDQPVAAGENWYIVSCMTESDSSKRERFGWGLGSGKEAILKLEKGLSSDRAKAPLAEQIRTAASRQVFESHASIDTKAKERLRSIDPSTFHK